MKKLKKYLAIALTAVMISTNFSTLPAEAKAKPKAPTCTKKVTVNVGAKKTIKVKKKKGIKIKKKTFRSTNKKIATVTKKGVVKGKKAGSCKIKVTVKYRYQKKLKTKKFKVSVKVKKKGTTPVSDVPAPLIPPAVDPGQTDAPAGTDAPGVSAAPAYDVTVSVNLISDNMKVLTDEKATTEEKEKAATTIKTEMTTLSENLKTVDTSTFDSEKLAAYNSMVKDVDMLMEYLNKTDADKLDMNYLSGLYASIMSSIGTVFGNNSGGGLFLRQSAITLVS